ncbi:DUF6119 family protein [Streptomyces sp. SCSIO 30461]|uniref:DUF6119 family protein n=1 Tax=Streptomyces sp. SCSIO 30461 TaxID=3118085 RepID=UPI0030D0AA9C
MLVAVQTLRNSPEERERFAEEVVAARQGRGLRNFQPSKVVSTVLLKDGFDLASDTLFLFSQVTLVQTARSSKRGGRRRSSASPPARRLSTR